MAWRAARRAALLGLVALGGCASWFANQSAALLAEVPPGLPPQAEKREVPFFAQAPLHCGPAALAMVLADAGRPVSPEELSGAMFLPERGGSLQVEVLAAARRQGVLAVPLPGRLEALLREVAAGHPVVVLQNLGLAIAPRWHYAVLVGYDLTQREVVLRSGTVERLAMAVETFELTWARAGSWAFVALPPGRLPLTAEEAATVQAGAALERSAPAAAATSYEAMLQRWPDSLGASLGLGNSRFAMGELAAAAAAFERAAQRHDSAVAWNNLARTRLALGRPAQAREAAEKAVARAEAAEPRWTAAARATLAEVGAAGR
jgi:hypothetical protein